MPRYLYSGTGNVRYGGQLVRPGDTIEASAKPGKNFALILDTKQQVTVFSTESKATPDVVTEGEAKDKPTRSRRGK